MEILEQVANDLKINKEILAKNSLKVFLNKELLDTEAEIFKIAIKHGIKSVFELDALLKKGKVMEEDIIENFMQFDYLESRRDELLKAIERIK